MDFNQERFTASLRQGLSELELAVTPEQLGVMAEYAQLIVETNKTLNLTRIVDPAEMAVKNFVDSLTLLCLAWPENLRCLDLGTGAGFPGVPLALLQPSWSLVLLDSLRKRLNFLAEAAQKLSLPNVTILHARAETVGQDQQQRESYDLVVSRAVASLPVLLELSIPLVKMDGRFVAYKSGEVGAELDKSSRAMTELGVHLEQVFPLRLPESMGERSLLVFSKTKPTPRRYPRRPGIPAKKPLE